MWKRETSYIHQTHFALESPVKKSCPGIFLVVEEYEFVNSVT